MTAPELPSYVHYDEFARAYVLDREWRNLARIPFASFDPEDLEAIAKHMRHVRAQSPQTAPEAQSK